VLDLRTDDNNTRFGKPVPEAQELTDDGSSKSSETTGDTYAKSISSISYEKRGENDG
jgi:hypothetical protein